MRSCRHARLADPRLPFERLCQRPFMLERLKTARRHPRAIVRAGIVVAGDPRIERAAAFDEAGDGWGQRREAATAGGDDTRAARPEQPFVTARHEEIAAEIVDREILDAETVHAIETEKVSAAPPGGRR